MNLHEPGVHQRTRNGIEAVVNPSR